jgi:serine O-acetyltransferase
MTNNAIALSVIVLCSLTTSFSFTWFPIVSKSPLSRFLVIRNNGEELERKSLYDLGTGKNQPIGGSDESSSITTHNIGSNWNVPDAVFVPPGAATGAATGAAKYDAGSKTGAPVAKSAYDLGVGKNQPIGRTDENSTASNDTVGGVASNWNVPDPVSKPPRIALKREPGPRPPVVARARSGPTKRTKKILVRNEQTKHLKAAIWDAGHYDEKTTERPSADQQVKYEGITSVNAPPQPTMTYPDIDLSIPDRVFSDTVDVVWDTLRYDAFREAEREPLLVSFMHSSILNHRTLESALAFHLANGLSSPAMISTQIQSLILEALDNSPDFRKSLRADMMAVRDRDPACNFLPDVFLYFKGFHALQTHRVAHYMFKNGRQVLAHYLQSQVSQNFQIDIHPNATIGSGVMMDHGTGIVVGETARIGHNCSILHHVTLGGSGKKGVDRHPKIGNGVLLGAGASVLGNVNIGEGCQIGAGTLVISDLPPHSVAVGVPAKIIGSFVDVTEQPGIGMNQMTGTKDFDQRIVTFESGGI